MKHLIAIAFVVLALAAAAPGQSVRQRMQEAGQALSQKKHDEAVKLYESVAGDSKAPAGDRLSALSRIVDIHRDQKRFDAAIEAAGRLLALQQDDAGRKRVMLQLADLHAAAKDVSAAVGVLRDLIARYPEDDENAAGAAWSAANHLMRDKRYAEAAEFFAAAAGRMDADDPRRIEALWNVSSAYWLAHDWAKAVETARPLTDPQLRAHPRLARAEANGRVIDGLLKLERKAEAVALLKEWERNDPDPQLRPRWCLQAARHAADPGDALASYRRLIVDHAASGISDAWYDAQNAIVDGHIRARELDAALRACHVLIDAAPDQSRLTGAVSKMADLLKKVDGNDQRARALVLFQLFGPEGPDGKADTEDDVTDPLPGVGYPQDAERRAAFERAWAVVGDDAEATYHRGRMCLYLGETKAAARLFLQAVRQADLEGWPTYVSAAVMNGWRPLRGHGRGMDAAFKYFREGQGDDPFAGLELADAPWPPPTPTSEQSADLAAVEAELWSIAEDPGLPPALRLTALRGLGRITQVKLAAGADAGTSSHLPTREEALARVIALTQVSDHGLRNTAAVFAAQLAKGADPHLAAVRRLRTEGGLPKHAVDRIDAVLRQAMQATERLASRDAGIPRIAPPKK